MTAPDDILRITEVRENLATLAARVDDHAEILAELTGDDGQPPGRPGPTIRWWEIVAEDRKVELAQLADWAADILLPAFGAVVAPLPRCWAEHPVCWFSLDIIRAFWRVLYEPPKRTLSILGGQADFQTRYLPALIAQCAADARGCRHRQADGAPR